MFNKRLREMRMKRGFTQQRLADTLGIALRSYQCYETGSRTPCYDLLILLADTLDVSLDYLLGRDKFMKTHAISFDEYL
ncbi:MAG: helix-turn-helix domain-containing protein [Lachnospiraceae bacterium]|nr:helix-turn-helix domain-containing protein [Lachnospiraceae bacterium]